MDSIVFPLCDISGIDECDSSDNSESSAQLEIPVIHPRDANLADCAYHLSQVADSQRHLEKLTLSLLNDADVSNLLNTRNDEIVYLMDEVATLRNENDKLSDAILDRDDTIYSLRYEDKINNFLSHETPSKHYLDELQELRVEKLELSKKLESAEGVILELNFSISELKEELSSTGGNTGCNQSLQFVIEEANARELHLQQSLNETYFELETQNELHQKQVVSLAEQLDKIKHEQSLSYSERSILISEVDVLTSKNIEMINSLKQMRIDHHNATTELKEVRNDFNELSEMNEQLLRKEQDYVLELDSLRAELGRIKANSPAPFDSNSDLIAKIQVLEQENLKLQTACNEFEAIKLQLQEKFEAHIEDLVKANQISEDNNTLVIQLRNVEDEIDVLKNTVKEMRHSNMLLSTQFEELIENNNSLKHEHASLLDSHSVVTLEYSELEAKFKYFKSCEENLRHEIADLQSEKDSLSSRNDGLMKRIDEIQSELERLTLKHDCLTEEYEVVSSKNSLLSSEVAEYKRKCELQSNELMQKNVELDYCSRLNQNHDDSRHSQQHDNGDKSDQDEFEALLTEKTELFERIKLLQSRNTELLDEVKWLKTEVDEWEKECTALKDKEQVARFENQKLKEHIEEVKQKCQCVAERQSPDCEVVDMSLFAEHWKAPMQVAAGSQVISLRDEFLYEINRINCELEKKNCIIRELEHTLAENLQKISELETKYKDSCEEVVSQKNFYDNIVIDFDNRIGEFELRNCDNRESSILPSTPKSGRTPRGSILQDEEPHVFNHSHIFSQMGDLTLLDTPFYELKSKCEHLEKEHRKEKFNAGVWERKCNLLSKRLQMYQHDVLSAEPSDALNRSLPCIINQKPQTSESRNHSLPCSSTINIDSALVFNCGNYVDTSSQTTKTTPINVEIEANFVNVADIETQTNYILPIDIETQTFCLDPVNNETQTTCANLVNSATQFISLLSVSSETQTTSVASVDSETQILSMSSVNNETQTACVTSVDMETQIISQPSVNNATQTACVIPKNVTTQTIDVASVNTASQTDDFIKDLEDVIKSLEKDKHNLALRLDNCNEQLCSMLLNLNKVSDEKNAKEAAYDEMSKEYAVLKEQYTLLRNERWKDRYHELEKSFEPYQEMIDSFQNERAKLVQQSYEYQSDLELLKYNYSALLSHQTHKQKTQFWMKLKDEKNALHKENVALKQEIHLLKMKAPKNTSTPRYQKENRRPALQLMQTSSNGDSV